jgi:hypothetical protein
MVDHGVEMKRVSSLLELKQGGQREIRERGERPFTTERKQTKGRGDDLDKRNDRANI